jgi:FG-GAP-like repeat
VFSNTTIMPLPRDRHYCVTMDVNKDGLDDIICNIGAFQGTGEGYNELFFSNLDGSITRVCNTNETGDFLCQSDSGLQKYPTMRNRIAATLRNLQGEREYVFMGTQGSPREDNRTNQHRMFRNVYSQPGAYPYFVEVPGPWTAGLFPAACAVAGDFTRDGLEDLVVCNSAGRALLSGQGANNTFYRVGLPANLPHLLYWYGARLADVTGDGILDLVVVTASAIRPIARSSYLKVFRGILRRPYFDFVTPYYIEKLNYTAPDVEVLDVNGDGLEDIYVVQVDTRKGMYCGPQAGVIQLPPNVTPPYDRAPDILYVGNAATAAKRFRPVRLLHSQPGCGDFVQRWDRKTMLLSQASFDNSGFQLLLSW